MSTPLTEAAKEGIAKLQEKVKANKGQVIFCSRDLSTPGEITGDFAPPNPHKHNHYEAGIVDGELERIELSHQKIDLPDLTLRKSGSYFNKDYRYLPEIVIPIRRKLSGFLSNLVNAFRFDIKDLEGIKDGSILIALNELPGEEFNYYRDGLSFFEHSFMHKDGPRLDQLGLYMGEGEVMGFLAKGRIKGGEELFDILKNPEFVKEEIDNHHYEKRKEFGEEFVITSNELSNMFRKLTRLEQSVMRAHFIRERDQDGSDISHWDLEEVADYTQLYSSIVSKMVDIKKQIKVGENLYLGTGTSEPLINGEIIGFPERISFRDDRLWLIDKISEINKTLRKINVYLDNERKSR